MQDQNARSHRVIQVRPGCLDLPQLAQNHMLEVTDGNSASGAGRVHSELAVQPPPGEALRSAQGEGAIVEPQVEIEAQGAAFERGVLQYET